MIRNEGSEQQANMKHIVFFSGGLGSFFTAKRVIERHGKENTILLFTDTKTEDKDLYRFLNDAEQYFGVPITYISDGRDIWQVFEDVNFIGNSRVAPCTQILKQRLSKKWIKENFKPDECVLYLGIDWTEEHRTVAPRKNWHPYRVEFPLCEEPLIDKEDMKRELKEIGIELPFLYRLGFSHNNCAGMCVKGGQGHWIQLLEKLPERFAYAERKEKELREKIGKDVAILSVTEKGVKRPMTLEELRKKYKQEPKQLDLFDIGGCGCFVDDDEPITCEI
jgi:3'-phosphoadenosine 5'-phosphosulfate sulfotransferase (PAPS reductase)/FAD synthetase